MGLTRPRAYQIFDIDYKQAVRVITLSNITLSGGAPAQVDGVNLVNNDRVLVAGQDAGSQNGIYIVTSVGTGLNGTWTRSVDGNETGEIQAGMVVMVTEGNVYDDTQWKLTTDDPITIGVTNLVFAQVGTTLSGNFLPTANATYTLGNLTHQWKSLYVSGNTIYVGDSTITSNANGISLTSPGGAVFSVTGTSAANTIGNFGVVSATGNVSAGNVITSGIVSATGAITGANITGANIAAANFLTNGILSATGTIVGGNLQTSGFVSSSGNVTGFTLFGATVNANLIGTNASLSSSITGGNLFTGGEISSTGRIQGANIIGANLLTGGQVSSTGNLIGGNIVTSGLISATGDANASNLNATANISAAGNVQATYYFGDGSYLTGVAPTLQLYEFANVASGVNSYYNAVYLGSFTPGTTANVAATVSTTGTYIVGFITATGYPNRQVIPSGLIKVKVETTKAAGSKNYSVYAQIYSRTNGGTETLIATTDNSTLSSVNTPIQQTLTAYVSTPVYINTTDRIVIKVYAFTSSGTDSITVSFDDNTASGLSLPALPASVATFVPYVNATANVDIGNHGIWAAGELNTGHQSATFGLKSGTFDYANSIIQATANNTGGADISLQNINSSGTIQLTLNNDQSTISTNFLTLGFTGSGWINPFGANGVSVAGDGYLAVVKDNSNSANFGGNLILGSYNAYTKIVAGNLVIANVTPTGMSVAGNVLTSGLISATGNVTGVTLTGTTVSGNLVGTSASLSGTVTAASTVGGVITGSSVSVTGTATAASTVGGVITGSSTSVTGTAIAASTVGGVITGTSVSTTGNITGSYILGDGSQLTNITAAAGTNITNGTSNVVVAASGNVTVGVAGTASVATFTTTGLSLSGNVTATTVNGGTLNSGSGDVAERYLADSDYAIGTVLAIGGTQEVTQSTGYAQTTVIGTVSEKPALIMNQELTGKYVATVAFLGRVPCRVVGNINRGDMLISSNTQGVATSMESYVPGSVLGKALESYNSDTPGVIEIIVGRL